MDFAERIRSIFEKYPITVELMEGNPEHPTPVFDKAKVIKEDGILKYQLKRSGEKMLASDVGDIQRGANGEPVIHVSNPSRGVFRPFKFVVEDEEPKAVARRTETVNALSAMESQRNMWRFFVPDKTRMLFDTILLAVILIFAIVVIWVLLDKLTPMVNAMGESSKALITASENLARACSAGTSKPI